jgi:hypothetical protein
VPTWHIIGTARAANHAAKPERLPISYKLSNCIIADARQCGLQSQVGVAFEIVSGGEIERRSEAMIGAIACPLLDSFGVGGKI